MKKSLLAMALVSAFAAPAFADTQVYGVIDAGVEFVDNGAKTTTNVKSGGQSDSRIGFQGSEALGGGLKAEYVLEAGIDLANGNNSQAGSLFGRQAWVGLTDAKMGGVRLGRQVSTMYGVAKTIDPNQLGLSGNAWNVLGGGSNTTFLSNAVTYVSPTLSGFKGEVQYGVNDTTTGKDSTYSLGGTYTAGAAVLTGAYTKEKANISPADATKTGYLVGGTYDLGVAKIHAGYGETKLDDVTTPANNGKVKNYLVGISAPLGQNGTLLASVARNKEVNVANSTTNVYSLGYAYNLSKRTNVYASYAVFANEAAADLGGASAVGKDVTKFGVGVRHSF